MGERIDVVVVGAGMSGLVAARELHRAGASVLVLESADRVGGRTLSETTALGSQVDLGGQWIGAGHHRFHDLAVEAGATPFVMRTQPLPRIVDGPRRLRPYAPGVLVAGGALALLELARRVRGPARWSADATVGSLVRRVPGRDARRVLEVTGWTSWTVDLDRLSRRTAVAMMESQGGLVTMLSTSGGAQDSLVAEGVGALTAMLADELGDRVRCDSAVRSIRRDEDGVTVRTDVHEVRAARVVVTAPPPTAARIEHEPALPADRVALQRDTEMGVVYKAIAVYPRPFWRDAGGGEMLAVDRPARAIFDSSPPDGPGHLTVLVGGPEARDLDDLDEEARRRVVLGSLAAHLGDAVLEPASWHDRSWHCDPHAGGGYLALPLPGRPESVAVMPSRPVGRVHWAGTETSDDHPGYIEGAIASGERVAREVLATGVGAAVGGER